MNNLKIPAGGEWNNRYSYAFKLEVIEVIENGKLSMNKASKVYGIHHKTIVEWMKKSGEVYPGTSGMIGYYYWKTGSIKEAEYYFNQEIKFELESIRLVRLITINRQAHFNLAKVYAFLGDKEKAYRYLDEVNKNKSFSLEWVTWFKYDPSLNSIRQEPRFQKILKDVEAKYQAEHERVRKWLVSKGEL